jgi:BirA family transcriptional regulator, biotin operon repressor / biotin---[acetyl-CoA-carboxylase] ligase
LSDWPAGYGLLELDSVDSTNEEARRRVDAGERGPLWITAKHQTAGRGRRGNQWQTLGGNLSATLLLRPEREPAQCAQLSFVAALAVCDMLARQAPQAVFALKWPNDVLAEGRKIAGILLESESGWLAAGIGINLASHPDDLPAISLAALGGKVLEPRDALGHLAGAFAKWYERWLAEGFAPVREAWLARAFGLGSRLRARLPHEEIEGVFLGLNETGALLLGLPGGSSRAITAGEVFFG